MRKLGSLLVGALFAATASAQVGPDITVLRVGGGNDFHYYGQSGGIAAYSFATTSCNPGDVPVQWTNSDHPVIGQNFFRLRDGLFEQIGQSWLKHGFCAVNEGGCGTCQSTPCSTLGIGCADTYWATLNDGQGGGPKFLVNPVTGVHSHPYPSPVGPSAIRGRLQVQIPDIDPNLPENANATWFAEGQYVSAHEAQAGNAANSQSWKKLDVQSVSNINQDGGTNVGESAVFAWRSEDPQVFVNLVTNLNEGGPGVHGYLWVASRAYDLGNGTYRYVYLVQNLNSKQSCASLMIPVDNDVNVSSTYFHDIAFHSGEPYNSIDWTPSTGAGAVRFECTETYAQNPDANAIRWGTAYTFAFEADSPPQNAPGGEIGLFEPGSNNVLGFQAILPGGDPISGTPYCFGDGSGLLCPCLNLGNTGHGCGNGTFWQGADLSGVGTASVGADSVQLLVSMATPGESGLFFQGDDALNGGLGFNFGDGLRCAGTNVIRLQTVFALDNGFAETSVPIGATGNVQPGDTKRYQYWYRDPILSPCGNGFNLSNGLEITWAP